LGERSGTEPKEKRGTLLTGETTEGAVQKEERIVIAKTSRTEITGMKEWRWKERARGKKKKKERGAEERVKERRTGRGAGEERMDGWRVKLRAEMLSGGEKEGWDERAEGDRGRWGN